MDYLDEWISGTDYNSQASVQDPMGGAVTSVVSGVTAIFGQIGANRYMRPNRFKPEDVIIPEQMRDNRAYITAGVAVGLLLITLLIIYLKS